MDLDDLKEKLKLVKLNDSEVSETASTQFVPYVLYTGKGDMMQLFFVYGELDIDALTDNDDMSIIDVQNSLPIKRVIVKHSTHQERLKYLRCAYYDIQEKNRSLVNRKAVEGISMDEFESFYVIFDRVKELMYGGSHARKMKTVLDLLLVKQTGGVESFIKEIVKLRDRFAQQGMPINDMWSSCILISGISNEELRDRLQMTVLTAKDEAEVTFEALARTCAKVEESTKDFAALEKARGGGKKVNGITNGPMWRLYQIEQSISTSNITSSSHW